MNIYLTCIFILLIPCESKKNVLNKRSIQQSNNYLKIKNWDRKYLTYSLFGQVASYNQTDLRLVQTLIFEAFNEWQLNSCFKFINVTPSRQADIKIIFTNDNYRSSLYEDDPLLGNFFHQKYCETEIKNIAAHAFFRYHKKFPAQIHVNNQLYWMESANQTGSISLKTVLLHEIGHILGLIHSNFKNSVMYKYIFTNQIKNITKIDQYSLKKKYYLLCKQGSS